LSGLDWFLDRRCPEAQALQAAREPSELIDAGHPQTMRVMSARAVPAISEPANSGDMM
jgi:hypothetical protein